MATRHRRDVDDLDDTLFDAEEAKRRRQERADAIERGQQAAAMLERADADARARVRADILRANDEFIAREYAAAGVEPLDTSPAGVPLVSLSLLLRVGWQIADVQGKKTLVAPPEPEKYVARGESR